MPIRVAINGFGRIGRQVLKAGWGRKNIQFVAINDLAAADNLAYLLKHDSVYGQWPWTVAVKGGQLMIAGKALSVLQEKDPTHLPWKKMKIDVVVESTGKFTNQEGLAMHLAAGARQVLLSAPAKGGGVPTIIRGINDEKISGNMWNNGSCTTNCVAPVAAVLQKKFGIEKATMTTIHSYTADQALVDGAHKDWRRGRSAALNMVPTSTGATIAVAEAIPELRGLFSGVSIRVPTPVGSLCDMVFETDQDTTVEKVNAALLSAAKTPALKGILACSSEPLVSTDIVGNSASSIVDLSLTQVVGGDLVKVVSWYDNEWGYAHRLVEMIEKIGKK